MSSDLTPYQVEESMPVALGLIDQLLLLAQKVGCSNLEGLHDVLNGAAFSQSSLIGALLDTGTVAERDFLFELAQSLDLEWREESEVIPLANVRDKFPARLALGFTVIPEAIDPLRPPISERELRLLTFDPFDYCGWQALEMYHDGPVRMVLTTRRRLLDTIKSTYGVGAETFEELIEGREDEVAQESGEEVNVVDEEDAEASVMKFVNQVIPTGTPL